MLSGRIGFPRIKIGYSVKLCHTYNPKPKFIQKAGNSSPGHIPVCSCVNETVHPVYKWYP